jgi:hypothetical protein
MYAGMTPNNFLSLLGFFFVAGTFFFMWLVADIIINVYKLFKDEYRKIREDSKASYKEILKLEEEEKDILKSFYIKTHAIAGQFVSLEDVLGKKRISEYYTNMVNKLKILNLIGESHLTRQQNRFTITDYGITVTLIYYPELEKGDLSGHK